MSSAELSVLEAFLCAAMARHAEFPMLLRGSFVTAIYVRPLFRKVNDLDFLALEPFDADKALAYIARVLADLNAGGLPVHMREIQPIFQDTARPGFKFHLQAAAANQPIDFVVDISYHDPVVPAPIWMPYLPAAGTPFQFHTAPAELLCAWKIHGLFEYYPKGTQWRVKDLYDILLFLRTCTLDLSVLAQALEVAFADRKTPFSVYTRFHSAEFGQSSGSRKAWRQFVAQQGGQVLVQELSELVDEVRAFLDPIFLVRI